jgi:hypothetical protein
MDGLMRLALVVLLAAGSLAQEPAQVVRGTWVAGAGSGVTWRGQWSAQPHPDVPGAAYGSWTILSRASQIVLQGTWSADKTAGAWRGAWSARTSANRVFSGTWETSADDLDGDTLMEMLQQTLAKQIAGSWRYGRLTGPWWLQGSRQ